MNLFILHQNPLTAAKMQANKHIVKMPEETGNLLLWPFKLSGLTMPLTKNGKAPKKLSHKNHPCSLWVRESKQNFDWTFLHLKALCAEYTARYRRKHFAETYIKFIEDNLAYVSDLPEIGLTPFARCFGDMKAEIEQNPQDTVSDYRRFYIRTKHKFARWPSYDSIPDWFVPDDQFVDKSFINGAYKNRKS